MVADEIKEVISYRKKMYNEVRRLRFILKCSKDENEYKEASFLLVEVCNTIRLLWKISNFYEKTSKMPNQYDLYLIYREEKEVIT